MLSTQETLPTGEVSKFVESYRLASEKEVWLIPDGTFHIVYSHTEFACYDGVIHHLSPGLYLFPISSSVIHLYSSDQLLLMRCKAFAIDAIGSDLFEVQQRNYWRFDSGLSQISHYQNSLSLAEIGEQEVLLENFVFDVLTNGFKLNKNLRQGVNYILDSKGDIKVDAMARDFGISRQSLHKYFKKHLGISPKQLAKIWKLNNFMDLARKDDSLTGAAIDSGYFDQAHCIKEFNAILGLSPRAFFAQNFDFQLTCIGKRFDAFYDPK